MGTERGERRAPGEAPRPQVILKAREARASIAATRYILQSNSGILARCFLAG